MLRYVERNPLRAGLVGRAEDWPWSSLACRLAGGDGCRWGMRRRSEQAKPRECDEQCNNGDRCTYYPAARAGSHPATGTRQERPQAFHQTVNVSPPVNIR